MNNGAQDTKIPFSSNTMKVKSIFAHFHFKVAQPTIKFIEINITRFVRFFFFLLCRQAIIGLLIVLIVGAQAGFLNSGIGE